MSFVSDYLADLQKVVSGLDPGSIERAILALRAAGERGSFVYSCGNGGSASIASQIVVDLVKGASEGRARRFKMLGLADSVATLTAYANDVNYESVFAEPLRNFAQKGDVLIAISGSGNSRNVLRAVEFANSMGCETIGLTSGMGGRLKDLVTLPVLVPSTHMGRLEDCFFIITHILLYAFIEKKY
ncbi:MAG: SIS domain-containing protein [Planctomycetes bacterium]|nr:SIS domain-containing protein [Planctomycetota bacterium]